MNTANKLTMLRIIPVPILLILIYNMKGSLMITFIAAALFSILSLTDTLDGYIARKYNQITDFGKFLDPLADKILVISTLIAFIDLGYISSLAVIIIIIREFLVTSLRLAASGKNVVIAASSWGKVKTVTQMIVVIILFFTPFINLVLPAFVLKTLIWIIVLITVFSGVDYLIKNFRLINHTK